MEILLSRMAIMVDDLPETRPETPAVIGIVSPTGTVIADTVIAAMDGAAPTETP
jgi:hypothetical protein